MDRTDEMHADIAKLKEHTLFNTALLAIMLKEVAITLPDDRFSRFESRVEGLVESHLGADAHTARLIRQSLLAR